MITEWVFFVRSWLNSPLTLLTSHVPSNSVRRREINTDADLIKPREMRNILDI